MPYSKHEFGTHKKKAKASLSFTSYPTIISQGISRLETLTYTTRIYYNPTIISQRIPRPNNKHTLPRFTAIPPKTVKGSLGPKQAWIPSYFFTNTLRNFPISTLRLSHVSCHYQLRYSESLGIFLRLPHSIPKPSDNPTQ